MQLETLDVTVRDYVNDYIKGLITNYEQRITELQNNYETSSKEYEAKIKESEYKYLELKEQAD
jgi:translation initiation factor RLI1